MNERGEYEARGDGERPEVPSTVADFWRDHLSIEGDRSRIAGAAQELLQNREWVAANPDIIVGLNQAMIDGAQGFDEAGNPVAIADGKLQSLKCVWSPEPGVEVTIPYIGVDTGDGTRPMYFFSGYSFHPDVKPVWSPTKKVKELTPARRDQVWVVDTGWCRPGQTGVDIDGLPHHRAKGHGEAIVGLIKQLGGAHLDVELMQIRYSKGALGCAVAFPASPGSDELLIGFDELALYKTLLELGDVVEAPNIVNLSLGTATCPHLMHDDPIGNWMKNMEGIRFVVAAGNHGTALPSWPAAYATGVSDQNVHIDPLSVEIHSVGSGSAGSPDDFSGHGGWVTAWQDGSGVSVPMPASVKGAGTKAIPTDFNNATWTGTSFAAPRHAAEIARHAGRRGPVEIDKNAIIEQLKKNPRKTAGRALTELKGSARSILQRFKG